jgi:hypothetical protein
MNHDARVRAVLKISARHAVAIVCDTYRHEGVTGHAAMRSVMPNEVFMSAAMLLSGDYRTFRFRDFVLDHGLPPHGLEGRTPFRTTIQLLPFANPLNHIGDRRTRGTCGRP